MIQNGAGSGLRPLRASRPNRCRKLSDGAHSEISASKEISTPTSTACVDTKTRIGSFFPNAGASVSGSNAALSRSADSILSIGRILPVRTDASTSAKPLRSSPISRALFTRLTMTPTLAKRLSFASALTRLTAFSRMASRSFAVSSLSAARFSTMGRSLASRMSSGVKRNTVSSEVSRPVVADMRVAMNRLGRHSRRRRR